MKVIVDSGLIEGEGWKWGCGRAQDVDESRAERKRRRCSASEISFLVRARKSRITLSESLLLHFNFTLASI